MNSNEQNPLICQSLNDLATALSEGERTTYDHIFRTMELPVSLFKDFCSWSTESYTRNCIVNNDKFELILLCWDEGQMTPIHDHGGEECWVKVIEGQFRETIYQKDDSGELTVVKSGISMQNDITYMVDFMGYHSLENIAKERSMSLHLYAKPIRNCNLFDENSGEFVHKELVYDTVSELETNLK